MNELLIDEEKEKLLQRDGVIKIPFLTPSELEAVRSFYLQEHGNSDPPCMYDGIHMTIWHDDIEYKLRIKNTLGKLLESACLQNFKDYRAVTPQFIVKRPGEETVFPVHQDWSIVDERNYVSLNLWIPLQDVDETNGAMYIIKGSHRINRKVRGSGYLFPDFNPIREDLKPYMSCCAMKAGEALLFYHNTIHGSPPNRGGAVRTVVQVSIIPRNVPLQIFHQAGPDALLEVHYPNDDFSYRYKKLREESQVRKPTDNPTEVREKYTNLPPSLKEVVTAIEQALQ